MELMFMLLLSQKLIAISFAGIERGSLGLVLFYDGVLHHLEVRGIPALLRLLGRRTTTGVERGHPSVTYQLLKAFHSVRPT